MPVERRDLSSRRTQYVVRDLEIGQSINSEECSETAEGVARESEGRSRVSLLRPVRQDQPRGHPSSSRMVAASRSSAMMPSPFIHFARRRSATSSNLDLISSIHVSTK